MKKSKSILIVTEYFYPEEFGINELAQEWQGRGYDVGVLTLVPSYPFDRIYDGYINKLFQKQVWNGITIYRVCSLIGYKKNVFLKILHYLWFAFLASFAIVFVGKKYDVVFVYQVGPLTQAIPAIIAKMLFRKNIYLWTLDIWPDSVYAYGFKKNIFLNSILNVFVKSVYRNCKTVFISCRGFAAKIHDFCADTKIVFAPQWPPQELICGTTRAEQLPQNRFHFTFAGNIGKVQNLESIIRAFGLAVQKRPLMALNIIGDGSNLEQLKKIVQDENIASVFFWGRRPLMEMPQWFEGSDVLVISLIDQPIFSLTIPAKFQAYLAASKPILCAMKGEAADLVKTHSIGLTADPMDIVGIKSVFEKFFNMSKQELDTFKKSTKELLKNEFCRDLIIQAMTEEIFGKNT